jgi:hypothetical protein
VTSRKAVERVKESVTKLIEKRMKLVVNREKSKVALASGVKFLGMTIIMGTIAISALAMDRAMEKIKKLTPRRSHKTIEAAIGDIGRWYRGWTGYFGMPPIPESARHTGSAHPAESASPTSAEYEAAANHRREYLQTRHRPRDRPQNRLRPSKLVGFVAHMGCSSSPPRNYPIGLNPDV